jgi:hypothetical protein
VHAPAIYNEITCWTARNASAAGPDTGCAGSPGVDGALHEFFGVSYGDAAMKRDGFNFLALHCGRFLPPPSSSSRCTAAGARGGRADHATGVAAAVLRLAQHLARGSG